MNASIDYELLSPSQADHLAANVFEAEGDCELLVSEERAFLGEWLSLGKLALVAGGLGDASPAMLLRQGAFEWQLPKRSETVDAANELLGLSTIKSLEIRNRSEARLTRAVNEVASIAARVGFVHTTFDPAALEQMPFRRSTTIVVDTSGVLQGALDFVARFLHPAARVKIPAIAQMEIANQADRFLGVRRFRSEKPQHRLGELLEHLTSQGGQRALLRVELQYDTEVERTYLLGDPLRSAFGKDKDPDIGHLNISSPIRSYCDRLILEAARQHQAQSGPAHVVRLLTGDQGLARMAMAEGVRPLFFLASNADKVFGRRLSGQTFDPFTGHIRGIPLTTLVWELATCFGSVRLHSRRNNLQVSAIGENLSWAPYHAVQDLLWCHQEPQSRETSKSEKVTVLPDRKVGGKRKSTQILTTQEPKAKRTTTYARLSVNRLLHLVCALDDNEFLTVSQIREILGHRIGEYRRFLQSGDFVRPNAEGWSAGERVRSLSAALRNERIEEAKEALFEIPSFYAFATRLSNLSQGEYLAAAELGRGATTFRVLGELTLICASVTSSKIYPTPNVPSVKEFSRIARQRFSSLDREGGSLVAAGEWLEVLIQADGIHPEVARNRLNEASREGLLRRTTEGSTTQLRNRDRVVHVLRTRFGLPVAEQVFLYRGDYLIPGKASVSLRIGDPAP